MKSIDWKNELLLLVEGIVRQDDTLDFHNQKIILVKLWAIMSNAPSKMHSHYRECAESEVLHICESKQWDFAACLSSIAFEDGYESIVKHLACAIRCLDKELSEVNCDLLPEFPNCDWRVNIGESKFFLIPIPKRKECFNPEPRKDRSSFSARGVKYCRIVPCELGGWDVELTYSRQARPRKTEVAMTGHLFECFKHHIEQCKNGFLITKAEIPRRKQRITEALKYSHHYSAMVSVFPEVTIDDDGLEQIISELQSKPWIAELKDEDLENFDFLSPDIVVAGSWHRALDVDTFVNSCPVLDGHGNELLRYEKRVRYFDKEAMKNEGIVTGKKLPILIQGGLLFGFGICLDFCDKILVSQYCELGVDFILVPSFGGEETAKSHSESSKDLYVRSKTKSFVLQNDDGDGGNAASNLRGYMIVGGAGTTCGLNNLEAFDSHHIFDIKQLS